MTVFALLSIWLGWFVGAAMVSSSWLFSADYWRELWLQPIPEPTFGRSAIGKPIKIVGRVLAWIALVVAAYLIERDVEGILATQQTDRLNPYIADLAVLLVAAIAIPHVTGLLSSLPFAIRRVHRADPDFATRHGVAIGSVWRLFGQSFTIYVVSTFAMGCGALLIADWTG